MGITVNKGKIIIKYDLSKLIIFGEIKQDDKANLFFPEIILEYNDINQMENQFNFFEKNEYDSFIALLNSKEKITLKIYVYIILLN